MIMIGNKNMIIYVLIILGVLSVLYGMLILQVGSGTSFWLIWEAIGLCFFGWAVFLHTGFFVTYPKIKMVFQGLVIVGVIALVTLCGMIATEFTAGGNQNLDYIIVLGAQVRKEGPSVALRYRLDAAVDYLNKNPDTMCIVSGGQGANEPFSEAEGMAEYLVENGIEKNRILLEDKSTNTVENIQYSKELMEVSYSSVGIVTNNFHMFRAVRIARAQGLKGVCGIAADSSVLYLPNNALRECCGILKDWIMKNI